MYADRISYVFLTVNKRCLSSHYWNINLLPQLNKCMVLFSIPTWEKIKFFFPHRLNLLFQSLYGRSKKKVSKSHHQALDIGLQEATVHKLNSNVVGFTNKTLGGKRLRFKLDYQTHEKIKFKSNQPQGIKKSLKVIVYIFKSISKRQGVFKSHFLHFLSVTKTSSSNYAFQTQGFN